MSIILPAPVKGSTRSSLVSRQVLGTSAPAEVAVLGHSLVTSREKSGHGRWSGHSLARET